MSEQQAGINPGGLTILYTDDRHTASKHYKQNGVGYGKIKDYDLGFWFRAEPRRVADLRALYDLICAIRPQGNAYVVRGELNAAYHATAAGNPGYRITRRKNPSYKDNHPAHLLETPRQWLMHDLDNIPLPPGADLRVNPDKIVGEIIADVLPPEFQGVTCFYQWSSSAGIAPGFAKLHLFFWLDTPWDNKAIRRWIKTCCPHLDHAPFSAVQPHFIADPLIDGADPVGERMGWLQGEHDDVALPLLEDLPRHTRHARTPQAGRAATPGLYARSVADALETLGDGEGLSGFHAPLLAAAMQYAIACSKGRPRDDAEFYDQLREAIEQVPKRADRDVLAYLDADYLARITLGGHALIENSQSRDTTDAPPIDLPDNFGMLNTGLWFTPPPDKEGKQPDAIWVCAPFDVIGQCSSDSGEQWGVVLEWHDAGHWEHRWITDRSQLHGEASAVCAALDDKGLRCSTNAAAQNALKRFLATVRTERRLIAVDKGGWQGNGFILPNGTTIGGADVFMRSEVAKQDLGSAQQGSLSQWNHAIGRYCVGNSRLGMFVSAAFAGPLLDLINEPSGGIHLFGGSQKGKTTAAYVAASVWGKGARDGKVQQWRATANGLEGVAARANDGFLVMDEISQSEAKEAGETAYSIANGQGKQRADRYGSARHRQTWRLIFISTGEVTLAQRLAEANRPVMTGMEVRLIDVQMDGGAGMGVFEHLHDHHAPGKLSDHLRDASATYYGTPIRAYLAQLAILRRDDPEGLADCLRMYRETFIAKHVPAGADGQVRSVAGRFGVIAAGGELAIGMGVLDWPEGEADGACARCFHDWLTARGTIGSGEAAKGIAKVQRFIELHGNSRFLTIHAGAPASSPEWQTKMHEAEDDKLTDQARVFNQAGYRRYDAKGGRWMFMFTPEVWKSEVCAGLDPEGVASAIAEKGWLDRETGHLAKLVRLPKQEKRVRLYVVSGDILAGADA